MAISLQSEAFISHSYCQAVLNELWCGRSAMCGKVCLRERPTKSYRTFLQVVALLLLVPTGIGAFLVPRFLQTAANDQFEWKQKNGQPQYRISSLQEVLHLVHIPLVKQMLFMISHLAFVLFFVVVAFQPLCGPLNSTHYIFAVWLGAYALHIAFHITFRSKRWWGDAGSRRWLARLGAGGLLRYSELLPIILLIMATYLRIRLDDSVDVATGLGWFGLPPVYRAGSQLDFVAGNRSSTPMTSGGGNAALHVWTPTTCEWSVERELLRTLLAMSTLLLFGRCTEFFLVNEHSPSGIIIICVYRMLGDLVQWGGPMLLVTCSFGLSFNLLAQKADRDGGLTAWAFLDYWGTQDNRFWRDFQLDLQIEGPFWAPFWGVFDLYYAPEDIVRLQDAAVLTPVFVWVYLLIALVLFVNLLIATFNARYDKVSAEADAVLRMRVVHLLRAYIVQYPLPPPFNLPALMLDVSYTYLQMGVRATLRPMLRAANRWRKEQTRFALPGVYKRRWKASRRGGAREGGAGGNHAPAYKATSEGEVEALVLQARDKLLRKLRFDSWKAEEGQRNRFNSLEVELKEMKALLEQAHHEISKQAGHAAKPTNLTESRLSTPRSRTSPTHGHLEPVFTQFTQRAPEPSGGARPGRYVYQVNIGRRLEQGDEAAPSVMRAAVENDCPTAVVDAPSAQTVSAPAPAPAVAPIPRRPTVTAQLPAIGRRRSSRGKGGKVVKLHDAFWRSSVKI